MNSSHEWMRGALLYLYQDVVDADLRAALTQDAARHSLQVKINNYLVGLGVHGGIPEGEQGSNLFHGLLAIRSKFDRETGMAKLEKNLTMREESRGPR